MIRPILCLALIVAAAAPALADWRVHSPHDGRQARPPESVTGGETTEPGAEWPQDDRFRWITGRLEVPPDVEGRPTAGRPIGLRVQCGDGGEVWVDGELRSRFDNDHPALVIIQRRARPGAAVRVDLQVYGRVQGGDRFGEARWALLDPSRALEPVRLRAHPDIDEGAVPAGVVGLSQGGGLADYEDATAAKLREGGFRWFRMDNVFTPVVREKDGELTYDWTDFDRRVEFIAGKMGADPVLAVSYMPIPFDAVENHDRQSAPRDYGLWEDLCYRAARRCVERGHRVPFWEVWNEVNTGWLKPGPEDKGSERFRSIYRKARGRDDMDEEAVRRFEAYCKLYRATARGILRADPEAKIGGPALASGPFEHEERGHCFHGKGFAKGLMLFCEEEGLPLDFLSWHEYFQPATVFVDEVRALRSYLRSAPRIEESVSSYMVTEWNQAWWADRPHDHEIGAAWCANTITRAFVPERIDRPCFFYVKQNDTRFRGDFSLLMQDNVPKASFNVMKLFNGLTGRWIRVSGGDEDISAVAAWDRDRGRLAIIVVNFRDRYGLPRDVEIGIDRVPEGLVGGRWREWVVDATRANVWHDRERAELQVTDEGSIPGDRLALRRRPLANSVTLIELLAPRSGAALRHVPLREGRAACDVHVRAEPPVGSWSADPDRGEEAAVAWRSSGGYLLTATRSSRAGHGVWDLRLVRGDRLAFRVEELEYRCRTPLGRVASLFDTQAHRRESLFRRSPQIDAAIGVRPNQGVPFQMACDHYGRASMAIGAMDPTGTYRITGRRQGAEYVISLARREYAGDGWFGGEELRDGVFLSTRRASWYDTARAYADAVDSRGGYRPRSPHPGATLPYYSTWYSFRDRIDADTVRRQARLARDVGCGVFLIFIGWSECENWFSSENAWGDYDPCRTRFPDFADLVRHIRADLGMAVQVWAAPTWIGSGSKSFARMEPFRSKWPEGGYDRNLDPRSPEARDHIRERMRHLAETWGVDGIYVDFADTLFNRNDAPHEKSPAHFGSAYAEFLDAMADGLESVRPRPIIEMREPFANLLSKRSATVFTTTYTDGDWRKSRMISLALRPFARGVVTRCDPLTFSPRELDDRDAVGKAFSAMLFCGPPGISMDLEKLDDEQRGRIRRWLEFYREHREDLTRGTFRPFGREHHSPEMMIHRGPRAYAWVSRWETGEVPFPPGTRHAYLFTALPVDVSFIARVHPRRLGGLEPGPYRARWFDSSLECHDGWFEITIEPPRGDEEETSLRTPRENWDFHPDEEGVPSLDVRRGGYLELLRSGP